MAAISDVATAISLIGKVIKAATNAQLMKKEFKELVDYLELVGKQFEMLDDRELGDASMQTLQKMEEVLLQCHDLAISCQQRSSIYLVVKGKRIQNELRGAQEKITKYLTLIPLIHFTQVFRRFKEEETNINENWHEHASNELDIPGLVAERIAEFTDNRFQSNAHLFTYEQIVKMTHNFETVIGRGGFGIVYYGLLEDGTDVAIKLQRHSSQQSDMEFFAELRSLTQVHHTNLISLIGYCKDRSYLAIVYEYMPQGNLQDHLRGEAGFPVLTWVQRLQIAYQAAQGLDYLHTRCNPPIVHRDVKSSNILLGADLEAKITDFGISKAWNENDTYTTTRVVGTVGYIDPAYFRTGYASDASDVYSFGIILLEMITGQPPIIRGPEVQQHIVQWISLRVTGEGDFVDTSMNEYYDPSSVWNVLQLALSCTDLSASRRPRMAEVVIQLKEIIEMKPLKQMTEDMNDKDMENEQVEEAFVTSIAQADRPICMHKLSANLFTSWTHNTPGRRFWRCKNWKMAGDCGFFKWHDPVQESVAIEQLDFVIHQSEELDEEIMILDEESAILFCKLKVLQEKLVECKRSKKALEMKLESMDRFYVHM
ncbi:probable leucine-rich repeat receptor-like protein kinase At2g28990 isoform X1 [Zingiber officinale]|uniref:probable leucine-rich repeat receptor-like protein kinase At2g28990 isoform X1 n=1 Tax=Zingiber officinale TaxID=94328 RepID=UPI001C4C3E3A|nr:probable leucine-rich repeat receptor-like protein kinase At2g28990 isoform X1 [Zingiber officinale]XP_042417161.1 probable leucine-rich repeat receptor-like protein kinase At2g28990 isoform X1 [Zingiber officinale]XP_042417162.1 probable leucine-rich repeat receptor-like protein kinase At2g28990 isoform X1 [Zingiber officinale]